jgi:hypothetical protein
LIIGDFREGVGTGFPARRQSQLNETGNKDDSQ